MRKALMFFNIVLILVLVGCQSSVVVQPKPVPTSPPKSINTQTPTPTTHPTAIIVTDVPEIVKITSVSFTPLNNSKVGINAETEGLGGVGITLRVSYNTSPDNDDKGEWIILKELGAPKFIPENRPVWDISDLPAGTYLVKVEAKTPENPNWENAVTRIEHYTVNK